MRVHTVNSHGREWSYRITGDGDRTLILLPGALGSGELLAGYVSSLLPRMRILVPEYLPVHSVAEFLDAFEEMLLKEKVSAPDIYGGSFGGLLAQCWIRKNPIAQSLTLSGAAFPDPRRVSKHRLILRMLPFIPISLIRMMMRTAARRIVRGIDEDAEKWLQELQTLANKVSKDDLASRYRTAMDFDLSHFFEASDLQNSKIKIMLLEGSKDKVANELTRTAMRTLYPTAAVVTIQDGGHSTLLTHPTEWAAAVNQFLRR